MVKLMAETRPGMPHTSPLAVAEASAGSCTLPVCSAIRRSDSLAIDVAAVMMFTPSVVNAPFLSSSPYRLVRFRDLGL